MREELWRILKTNWGAEMDFYMAISLVLLGALILTIGYTVYVRLFSEKYTRERFAFASLTATTTLIIAAITQISSSESLAQRLIVTIGSFFGAYAPPVAPVAISEKILIAVLAIFGVQWIHRLNKNWHGQISVEDYQKQRLHIEQPWVLEGLDEGGRILRRQSPRTTRAEANRASLQAVLSSPTQDIVWHQHARELVELWATSVRFISEHDGGWNSVNKYWRGQDLSNDAKILLFCETGSPDSTALRRIAKYVQTLDAPSKITVYVAVRDRSANCEVNIDSVNLKLISEEYLLEHLVDFSDYFLEIKRRVLEVKLPDSDLTIPDVYVESQLLTDPAMNNTAPFNQHLIDWTADPPGTQIAILGEYGQGKSTGALMFVHKFIEHELHKKTNRVPILFELRGKSPSNLSASELLATWAQQYRIHASALLKLLVAGRLLVIFEGFDEMANVADVEQRVDQFRALWRLSYPQSKLIFTGRPNLFFQQREIEIVFRSDSSGTRPICEILHLKRFDRKEIELALRWTDPTTRTEILNVSKSNLQLRDILSRPSLLYIVGLLWPQLKGLLKDGGITSADVIGRFIDHSLKRQTAKQNFSQVSFMNLSEGERRYFHEGVAGQMAVEGWPNQISKSDFNATISRLYDKYPSEGHLIAPGLSENKMSPLKLRLDQFDNDTVVEMIATDVRTHGVIVNDPTRADTYRFAHKSFFEFLAARAAAYLLLKVEPEFYGAIAAASGNSFGIRRSKVMLGFFGEIIVKNFERGGGSSKTSIESMLFDNFTRIDRFPPIFRGLFRRWLLISIWLDGLSQVFLKRFTKFRSPLVQRTVESLGGAYLASFLVIAPIAVFFVEGIDILGLNPNTSAPLPLRITLLIAMISTILLATFQMSVVLAHRQIELWAACLLLGGRTETDLGRFIGLQTTRRLMDGIQRFVDELLF